MKKTLLLISAMSITLLSNAQNVWTGTTIPTTTVPGKVGIGTTTLDAKLNIKTNGEVLSFPTPTPYVPALNIYQHTGLSGNATSQNLVGVYSVHNPWPGTSTTSLLFGINSYETRIGNKLRIGATQASAPYNNYALSVDGDIIAKKIVVQVSNWADYVFADDYVLRPLNEVESFIKENKHLPEVPSEKEIVEKGLDLNEMNTILMKKVEELTLYMIEQDKKIKELEAKIITK